MALDLDGFQKTLEADLTFPQACVGPFMNTLKEYQRTHGRLAIGETDELHQLCKRCYELQYLSQEPKETRMHEIQRTHNTLIEKIQTSGATPAITSKFAQQATACYESIRAYISDSEK